MDIKSWKFKVKMGLELVGTTVFFRWKFSNQKKKIPFCHIHGQIEVKKMWDNCAFLFSRQIKCVKSSTY